MCFSAFQSLCFATIGVATLSILLWRGRSWKARIQQPGQAAATALEKQRPHAHAVISPLTTICVLVLVLQYVALTAYFTAMEVRQLATQGARCGSGSHSHRHQPPSVNAAVVEVQVLQFLQYMVIDRCDSKLNQLLTMLAYIHVSFQPLVSWCSLLSLDTPQAGQPTSPLHTPALF